MTVAVVDPNQLTTVMVDVRLTNNLLTHHIAPQADLDTAIVAQFHLQVMVESVVTLHVVDAALQPVMQQEFTTPKILTQPLPKLLFLKPPT